MPLVRGKSWLLSLQEQGFSLFVTLSYILLLLSMLGLYARAPNVLAWLDMYARIYICLFLIWRFNPLRSRVEFTHLDRKIAFSAGLVILTTSSMPTLVAMLRKAQSLAASASAAFFG